MGERFGFVGGGRGLEALDVDVGVLYCQGVLRCCRVTCIFRRTVLKA